MSKTKSYPFLPLLLVLCSFWLCSCTSKERDAFSERAKVSLRAVGHQLLLTNQDSTSLVKPVVEVDQSRFELSFQNHLAIHPDSLVDIVENSFKKSQLSSKYLIEVINCTDHEVAYSYEMANSKENSIVPCGGRILPINCYTIQVKFINKSSSNFSIENIIIIILSSIVVLFFLRVFKKNKATTTENLNGNYNKIGSFQFYPEQNKLIKEAIEISLSKKECELLEIFVANPNQIIKRDELTKKVWEDNGVFVGRSLDTYISKLRKKLKHDDTIKLTNVHGVGYKLEVNS